MKVKKKSKKIFHKIWENTYLNYHTGALKSIDDEFNNLQNLSYIYESEKFNGFIERQFFVTPHQSFTNKIYEWEQNMPSNITYMIALSPHVKFGLEIFPCFIELDDCPLTITSCEYGQDTMSKMAAISRFLYETEYFKYHKYASISVNYVRFCDIIHHIQIIYKSNSNIREIRYLSRKVIEKPSSDIEFFKISSFSKVKMVSTIPIVDIVFKGLETGEYPSVFGYTDFPELKVDSLPIIPLTGIRYKIEKHNHGAVYIFNGNEYVKIHSYDYMLM